MNWHSLPIRHKKDFIIVLQMAQNAKLLTACGVLPLNMDTFVLVRISNLFSCFGFVLKIFNPILDNEEDLWTDNDVA